MSARDMMLSHPSVTMHRCFMDHDFSIAVAVELRLPSGRVIRRGIRQHKRDWMQDNCEHKLAKSIRRKLKRYP
ncbi:MAG: hypothetical protein JWR85_3581 [Marmoricola sp.]|nr:hypothetical protein [Marmoricola sp.]